MNGLRDYGTALNINTEIGSNCLTMAALWKRHAEIRLDTFSFFSATVKEMARDICERTKNKNKKENASLFIHI